MMNINFDLPYEGYLWMSNKNHPCVYCPEALIDRGLFDGHNPFVTEGYLFNHVPLKQGLRLFSNSSFQFTSASLNEYLPLKQGLRLPIGQL